MNLGQFRDNQAEAAEQGAGLQARQRAARQVHQPEDDKDRHGQRHHRVGRIGQRCEGLGPRDGVVKKQGDWSVEPLVGNSGRDRGSGKAQRPFLQRIHRLVDYHIFRALAGGRETTAAKRETPAAAVCAETGVCRLAFGPVFSLRYCGWQRSPFSVSFDCGRALTGDVGLSFVQEAANSPALTMGRLI